MKKTTTINRFIFRSLALVTVVVVLTYTFAMNFYFIQGLDESNFQSLRLEGSEFAKQYQQDKQTPLPNSIHFRGYLSWQETPSRVKTLFDKPQKSKEISYDSRKTRHGEVVFGLPNQVSFLVSTPLDDGKRLYLVRELDVSNTENLSQHRVISIVLSTLPLAALFLLVAYLLLQRFLKRTLAPFHQLGEWVDALTPENVDKALPDFEFAELNRIAKQQQQTLQRIGLINKKEQDFLRHASHELRTPIAVVKSNSELLIRILKEHKAATSVARIQRAGLNMQHMTETLLWLSREDNQQLGKEPVDLALLLEQLIEDNQYLLQSKQVEIKLVLDKSMVNVATTPCRLILNNLIRNAFQYTNNGVVELKLSHGKISLKNIEQATINTEHNNSDYGYGLGLQLVDKIIDKMDWPYNNQEIEGGRLVTLNFDFEKES